MFLDLSQIRNKLQDNYVLWMKSGWIPSIMDETWMLMDEIQPLHPSGSQD